MRRYLFLALALLPCGAGAQINPNPADAITQKTFANLGTPPNGIINYCVDCQQSTPCTGSGSGAFAQRVNGVWECAASNSAGVTDPGADGFMVRTAEDVSTARSLTSPLGTLAIGNSDGVAGNPTLDVDTSIIGQFSSGAGTAPATCVQGDFYLETDTGFVTACPATDAPNTLIGKAETSTSGYGFVIDEDSFATDSATKVPTQQSVKAYVDANAGAAFDPSTTFQVYDDFLGGNVAAGTTSWTGMSVALAGTGTATYADGVSGHPGMLRLNSHTSNDNSGAAVYWGTGTYQIETGLDGNWQYEAVVLLGSASSAITNSALWVGFSNVVNSVPGGGSAGIWIRYDSDTSDTKFICQICDSASSGCAEAADNTNSNTVASTLTATANTWYRFKIRRAISGVGGNPTIYMSVGTSAAMETELTFCASGCDETLANYPALTSGIYPTVAYYTRTTSGVMSSDVDYMFLRISGVARY